jgi:hypothetical protein
VWGVVQIVLGGLFFFLLLFGTHLGKFPLADEGDVFPSSA